MKVSGLKLHVAEIGSESSSSAPVVVFLHGFPEIWYSWRYQMLAIAKSSCFRAIAFDYRCYGLSEKPAQTEKTTFLDLVNDLLGLLDALSIPRSEIPIADENQEILDLVEPDTPLPFWFSEKDLAVYGTLYEKSRFQSALKVHVEIRMLGDSHVHQKNLLLLGMMSMRPNLYLIVIYKGPLRVTKTRAPSRIQPNN
ncbi:hypothetical protein RND71_012159 [Anisodus tanguticus]|uniref:AB hydrolase-1 domain-containing protein n=1 Tax=Anisodus tanguticus TaxID=243964 RepID=A0AAE1SEW4_9SOLA|nr:hypothetical protein RND71_012159 [Anisodus tanguticus]